MKIRQTVAIRLLNALVSVAGLSASSSAFASVTEYTSQSAFDAANPAAVTYGFNSGGAINAIPNSSTFSGVTFVDSTTADDVVNSQVPLMFVIDSADVPTYGVDFLSFENQNPNIEGVINPTGTTFFGFNYGSFLPIGGDATVTLNTGDSYVITPISTEGFIGFSSSTPITSITIDYPNGYAFDVISYSTVAAAPEPAAWLMMLMGVGGVGAALRWRSHPNPHTDQLRAV